jgi:hypothetical protein
MREEVWTGCMWLRIGTSGGFFWLQLWTFGFHNRREISLAQWLLSSQEGFCSMQLCGCFATYGHSSCLSTGRCLLTPYTVLYCQQPPSQTLLSLQHTPPSGVPNSLSGTHVPVIGTLCSSVVKPSHSPRLVTLKVL